MKTDTPDKDIPPLAAADGSPSDAEMLQWCLDFGFAKCLGGGADDWEYHKITLPLVQSAIKRGNVKKPN